MILVSGIKDIQPKSRFISKERTIKPGSARCKSKLCKTGITGLFGLIVPTESFLSILYFSVSVSELYFDRVEHVLS